MLNGTWFTKGLRHESTFAEIQLPDVVEKRCADFFRFFSNQKSEMRQRRRVGALPLGQPPMSNIGQAHLLWKGQVVRLHLARKREKKLVITPVIVNLQFQDGGRSIEGSHEFGPTE